MAEIKIEKKKPVWPWVILILVVLAIIAYLVYDNDNDMDDDFDDDYSEEQVIDSLNTQSTYDPYNNSDTSSTYDQFTAYDEAISDSTRVAIDSSYTKNAFANLAKVVVHKADEHAIAESPALTDLRNFSSLKTSISTTTKETEGFKNFKTATDKIVTVMETVQQKSFPSLQTQMADLKQSASKIDGSKALKEQQHQIYTFFRQSRDVLKMMNN
ncbi:hypothetical protein BXY82_2792 [Gelidibacter sediminis]|uniref:Uncharacterized protein n=1 Tax=Gelidibacter sediminis TaxID=1608710 RepID=A0A4R7PKR7_9FLAO|nr:hypothetical protein [Gelidibacter sediminis]TDU34469.1 hypothetical protein BXY82_2792 [Gelidibacter sediminis]